MLGSYFEAWRFWRDGPEIWAMDFEELADAITHAIRIHRMEQPD